MVKKIRIVLAIALIFFVMGVVAADERLKIISPSDAVAKLVIPEEKIVSLEEAKAKMDNTSTKENPVTDAVVSSVPNPVRDAKSGIEGLFIDLANEIFKIVFGDETIQQINEEYGYGAATVYRIAAAELNPYDTKAVQGMRKDTAFIGLFAFLCSILIVGIKVNLSAASMGAIDRMIYTVTQTVSTFGQFRDNIIMALGGIIGIHYILKFIVMLNHAMTASIMTSALQYIPLDLDNWVVYLVMAFCYLFEAFFYGIRFIMMGLISGADIILGGLFAFPAMRSFVIETVKYFTRITFMQFIVVFVTFFGITLIDDLPIFKPLACICLTVVILVISGVIVFGFSSLFKATKAAAKIYKGW
jgi:hypothetical protein